MFQIFLSYLQNALTFSFFPVDSDTFERQASRSIGVVHHRSHLGRGHFRELTFRRKIPLKSLASFAATNFIVLFKAKRVMLLSNYIDKSR